jgi:TetR/AcrR family transcriptional regulator, lmrAB and yxaGH operons repressor
MTTKKTSKELLIETASRLFRMRGYDGVGLSDILKESGIPKGSMYHHFPGGKEELAVAAIHFTKQMAVHDLRSELDRFDDPVKGFQEYFLKIANNISQDPDLVGSPIGTLVGEKYATSEPIRIACQETLQELEIVYQEKLTEAGFKTERAMELSTLLNAIIEGAIILCLAENSGDPLRLISRQLSFILIQN